MFIFLKLSNFEPSRSYVEETTSMLQRTYRYNRFRIIIALLRLKMLQTSTYYSFDIALLRLKMLQTSTYYSFDIAMLRL